jgi:SAM-dependent methyltransferase
MSSRPAHLTPENAATFQLAGVVEHYHLRTPYPPELAGALLGRRAGGGPVLELGCGTGEIARSLAPFAQVEAFDASGPMLERARAMPGGDHPGIRWVESSAESYGYEGPYSLAVAGDSLHWMDWDVVLPALARTLAAGGALAIVNAEPDHTAWRDELSALFAQYSAMQNFESYDLGERLEQRGLFAPFDVQAVGPLPFTRSLDDYIESLHATSSMARGRVSGAAAAEFDAAVRDLVAPHAKEGVLQLHAYARITWGRPDVA